ncbi:hypothetical protein ACTJJB_17195 [Chitinophaga sp. 22536]|uniref:hypothetical protein n=1 Tax=unclassified Chitinophaga TaxID=2619133 RepID=UPI003F85C753
MAILAGKKILMICPRFFGYEKKIVAKLEELGADVVYYDERLKNTATAKIAIRFFRGGIKKRITKYYNNILVETASTKFDYIFFVNPETVLPELLEKFREKFQTARFILYMWDSLRIKPVARELLPYFNRIYSFDRNDTLINPSIKFRPLFFTDEFDIAGEKAVVQNRYDWCFFGTVHSDRYSVIRDLCRRSGEMNMRVFVFMYLQGKFVFYFRKLFERSLPGAKIEEFSFSPMTRTEISEIVNSSVAVLDIQHYDQTGLTIRTFEILGMGKKMITTNPDIVNYDFYENDNIWVIDRKKPEVPAHFFTTPSVPVAADIRHKYSLTGWIEEIFQLSNQACDASEAHVHKNK